MDGLGPVSCDGVLVHASVLDSHPNQVSVFQYRYNSESSQFERVQKDLSLSNTSSGRVKILLVQKACNNADGLNYVYLLYSEARQPLQFCVGRVDVRRVSVECIAKFSVKKELLSQDLRWNFTDGPILISSKTVESSIIVIKLGTSMPTPTSLEVPAASSVLGTYRGALSDYYNVILLRENNVHTSSVTKPSGRDMMKKLGQQGIFNRHFLDSDDASSKITHIISGNANRTHQLNMMYIDSDHPAYGTAVPFPRHLPDELWQAPGIMRAADITSYTDGNISTDILIVSIMNDGRLVRFYRGATTELPNVQLVQPTKLDILMTSSGECFFLVEDAQMIKFIDSNTFKVYREWPRQVNLFAIADIYGNFEEKLFIMDFKALSQAPPQKLKPKDSVDLQPTHQVRSETQKTSSMSTEGTEDVAESPAAKQILDAIRGRLQSVRDASELSKSLLYNKKLLLDQSLAVLQLGKSENHRGSLGIQRLHPVFQTASPAILSASSDDRIHLSVESMYHIVESPAEVIIQTQLRNYGLSPLTVISAFLAGSSSGAKVDFTPAIILSGNSKTLDLALHGAFAEAGGLFGSIQLELVQTAGGFDSTQPIRLFELGSIEIGAQELIRTHVAAVPPDWKRSSLAVFLCGTFHLI